MRAFDGLSNPGREWEPCVKCKSPNRFPTSLAFPGHTDIYSNGPGGWIIRPIGVGILCSCYADCGSQGWGAQIAQVAQQLALAAAQVEYPAARANPLLDDLQIGAQAHWFTSMRFM